MDKTTEGSPHGILSVQAVTSNADPDLRLLETFNHALSNIIRHPEQSRLLPSSQHTPCPKKPRSVIWFPDEDLRRGEEIFLETKHDEPHSGVIDIAVKQEVSENQFDSYYDWIDGSVKLRYALTSREAQSHSSGWAMKYTNNHNKYVLKKTCVGVLVCSENCALQDGKKVRIRPAISDKVRERQLGQQCPNPDCKNGRIVHRKCAGNNGYPVTHFWIHHLDCIHFESKGHHNHPRPEAKRTAMRKRETSKYNYDIEQNMLPQEVHFVKYKDQPFLPPHYPVDLKTFSRCLDCRGDYVRSCDVTDGNEYVCVATAPMRELALEIFSENNSPSFSKVYVLCRTLPSYVPGFDLLESRLLSCATPECPLVLVTLYRSGSVDGILEHTKHLAVMCSSQQQKIRVPKWHYLVHDFSRERQTLAVETVVNLMVDSQMQTLLNEFQYKSVSSLYKMLRQKIMGTLRSFDEHYRICRHELMLRIQDARILASAENMFARLQSLHCSANDFLSTDVLIKDGFLGTQVREFWYFWGSDIISSAVFPAAKNIYDTMLCRHHCSANEAHGDSRPLRIQDAFISVMEWLQKRSTIYPAYSTAIWMPPWPNSAQLSVSKWKPALPSHSFSQVSDKIPLMFPCTGCNETGQQSRVCLS